MRASGGIVVDSHNMLQDKALVTLPAPDANRVAAVLAWLRAVDVVRQASIAA